MIKFLMVSALAGFSLSVFADDGLCGRAAQLAAEKLYGPVDNQRTSFVDNVEGNAFGSGEVTYDVSAGNGEDGFRDFRIVIQQVLADDGSLSCEIVFKN